jgi:fanconi anemia group J protein|mmetsp:Transcript_105145/g.303306  ORF Transcript_105145/g.303306 Transcript_105145/m.303306 type:complete len:101 (+) Transcript_105145:150-452(+)
MDLPVHLEAGHCVNVGRQVWAGSLISSNGSSLLTNYESQDSTRYQDGVGAVLYKMAQVVPGGVLVFFPSYSLMAKLKIRWESTGLLKRIDQRKKVFEEPR